MHWLKRTDSVLDKQAVKCSNLGAYLDEECCLKSWAIPFLLVPVHPDCWSWRDETIGVRLVKVICLTYDEEFTFVHLVDKNVGSDLRCTHCVSLVIVVIYVFGRNFENELCCRAFKPDTK